MKLKTKNTLRLMAGHLGLKVKFVGYFSDDVHGKLLPLEKRILINAHKPRYEHTFTLLHEIGHNLLHFKNPHRKFHARFLENKSKIKWLVKFCSKVRRTMHIHFARENSREWEADLWAFCAFIYVVKLAGGRDDLVTLLEHHPEKFWVFMLAGAGVIFSGIKKRITTATQFLLKPFRAR
jgi:IrrE N-terminal-like domain